MKANIETHDGKVTLKVYYSPALCNLDEAIAAGLESYGLKQGQAVASALPIPHPDGTKPKAKNPIKGQAHIFNVKKQKLNFFMRFRQRQKRQVSNDEWSDFFTSQRARL